MPEKCFSRVRRRKSDDYFSRLSLMFVHIIQFMLELLNMIYAFWQINAIKIRIQTIFTGDITFDTAGV